MSDQILSLPFLVFQCVSGAGVDCNKAKSVIMFSCHSGILLAFKLTEPYPVDCRQCGQEPHMSSLARALFFKLRSRQHNCNMLQQVSGEEGKSL